jgi:hypothetical protein
LVCETSYLTLPYRRVLYDDNKQDKAPPLAAESRPLT